VVFLYFKDEPGNVFGYVLLGMILMTITMQMVVVVLQNHKRPRDMLRELLVTMLCLKAPVDAYRVATAKQQLKSELMDPELELNMSRGVELAFEAIPVRASHE
jgi:hypothetical protein